MTVTEIGTGRVNELTLEPPGGPSSITLTRNIAVPVAKACGTMVSVPVVFGLM